MWLANIDIRLKESVGLVGYCLMLLRNWNSNGHNGASVIIGSAAGEHWCYRYPIQVCGVWVHGIMINEGVVVEVG